MTARTTIVSIIKDQPVAYNVDGLPMVHYDELTPADQQAVLFALEPYRDRMLNNSSPSELEPGISYETELAVLSADVEDLGDNPMGYWLTVQAEKKGNMFLVIPEATMDR